MKNKKICVVGLGYIGLPTAALLANVGYEVIGVDTNQHVVDTINRGEIHIVEFDLDAYVRSAVASKRLKAITTPEPADIFMICVPTPFYADEDIPRPNLDFVLAATRAIAPFVEAGALVILESTSPVGATELLAKSLAELDVDISSVSIAYCPERVLPGKIMKELVENDRVVGGLTQDATALVSKFYRTFVSGNVLETDSRTAEMCKLTENSFRDVNIAFANEISMICEIEGIDVWQLINLANHHPRVNILQPGAGVGGHCIAVDPWFIVSRNPQVAKLIRASREVNDKKSDWVVGRVLSAISDGRVALNREPLVACLGLAFKPDIDDLRESPAMNIVTALNELNCNIVVVEPNINEYLNLRFVGLDEAFESADVFVILVKHRQFLELDVQARLKERQALDFCGALA